MVDFELWKPASTSMCIVITERNGKDISLELELIIKKKYNVYYLNKLAMHKLRTLKSQNVNLKKVAIVVPIRHRSYI